MALLLGLAFALLEEPLEPRFAPLFRGLAQPALAVVLVGPRVALRANPDPSTREHWDTDVTLTGARELYGFQCDSTLAYTALALYLSLWAASPLRGRRWATLWRGLAALAAFVGLRLGLMVLQSVATHECAAPGEHWSFLRQPWLAAGVRALNWEIGMDLVVAHLGPFLAWAVVCGPQVFPALGLAWRAAPPRPPPVRADEAQPSAAMSDPVASDRLAFDPFAPVLPSVVADEVPPEPGSRDAASGERPA